MFSTAVLTTSFTMAIFLDGWYVYAALITLSCSPLKFDFNAG